MLIHGLRLGKYKRLRLQDIKLFEISFKEIYQLIIGTNGSGKSSILRELTPMPANHKDYEKNGFKEIFITHNGQFYHLVSSFEHGNNHAFFVGPDTGVYDPKLRDDLVDINEGHTAKAQKALVEQHFALTQDVLDVLLGDVKFTSMSPLKRRDWILNLAGGDLEYAIDVHRKLNNLVNEQTAIVKHTQRRISEEQMKMISDDEYQELKRRVDGYKTALDTLYQVPVISDLGRPEQYINMANQAMARVSSITDRYLKFRTEQPDWFNYHGRLLSFNENIAHIKEYLFKELYVELSSKENLLNDMYKQVSVLAANLQKLEALHGGDINKLIEYRDETQQYINTTIATHPWAVRYIPPNEHDVISSWKGIYNELIEIFSSVEDNTQREITRSSRDRTLGELDVIRRDLDNDRALQFKYQHQLEHLQTAKHETCPNCNHQWVPGTENYLSASSLTEKINVLSTNIATHTRSIAERNDFVERCQNYNTWLSRFSSLVKNNPQHVALWDSMSMEEVYFQSPIRTLATVQAYHGDIEQSRELYPLILENDSRTTIIQQAQELKDSKAEVSETLLSETNAKIETLLREIEDLRFRTSGLSDWVQELETLNGYYEEAQRDLRVACDNIVKYWEAEANNTVIGERQEYQLKLSNTATALQSANNILNVINSLSENLTHEKSRLEKCRILSDSLSPRNGLIAECIRGIITELTDQMNNIIGEIWSYPLHILPCADEADETVSSDLKYRFPLSIENGTNVTEDVAKGSSAQRDVVDFAFLLCVYMYKDLDGYPLYLDELAPTMDELHRMQILQLVKLLIETKRNSQMFMISHYVSGHGAFTTAEICMLNDRNILNKPKEYNGHVVIQ